jgi:hypothetical protein
LVIDLDGTEVRNESAGESQQQLDLPTDRPTDHNLAAIREFHALQEQISADIVAGPKDLRAPINDNQQEMKAKMEDNQETMEANKEKMVPIKK